MRKLRIIRFDDKKYRNYMEELLLYEWDIKKFLDIDTVPCGLMNFLLEEIDSAFPEFPIDTLCFLAELRNITKILVLFEDKLDDEVLFEIKSIREELINKLKTIATQVVRDE